MSAIKESFDDPILTNVDLTTYTGNRYSLSDGKGNILEDTDTRDIFHEMALALINFRIMATEELEASLSASDRENAALGLASSEDATRVANTITAVKTKYQNKKALVLNCNTLLEVEQIRWED